MSEKDFKRFIEQMSEHIADAVVTKLSGASSLRRKEEEWVETRVAADIMGVTPNYLRSIKDRFQWRKVGGSKRGRVLFNRREIENFYLNN